MDLSGLADCPKSPTAPRPGSHSHAPAAGHVLDNPDTQLQLGASCARPVAAPPAPTRVQSGMENFRKVKTSEEKSAPPFPGLHPGVAEMKVKEGSKIRSLMRFAVARMATDDTRQIVFSGCGRAATKAVTCVEILKRKLPGLHQITRVRYRPVREVWEKPDPRREWRADRITVLKNVPCISILLSKDPLDPAEAGYQPPDTAGERLTETLQTMNAPPKTEKRHSAFACQGVGDKIAKVEDSALAQIHFDYMLNCYPPVPAHPSEHGSCVCIAPSAEEENVLLDGAC